MATISAVLTWIVFGLVVGLIARFIVPGQQPMGWFATIALGVIGSFAGGFLTYLFRGGDMLQPEKMVMSVLGAVVVLLLASTMGSPKRI